MLIEFMLRLLLQFVSSCVLLLILLVVLVGCVVLRAACSCCCGSCLLGVLEIEGGGKKRIASIQQSRESCIARSLKAGIVEGTVVSNLQPIDFTRCFDAPRYMPSG